MSMCTRTPFVCNYSFVNRKLNIRITIIKLRIRFTIPHETAAGSSNAALFRLERGLVTINSCIIKMLMGIGN